MVLCSVCERFDIHYLLVASLYEYHEVEPDDEADYFWHTTEHLCFKHHVDIYRVQISAEGGCDLCGAMIRMFQNSCTDREVARDVPLVLRARQSKIIASYDDNERLIDFCSFDVYKGEDSFLNEDGLPFVFLNKIHQFPGSRSCVALASRWLQDCLTTHVTCKADHQYLPTRTLNVGSDSQNPYLTEHPEHREGQWAALSYCWGGEPSLKLEKSTFEALKQGKPLEEFDASIRDAILITRGLGIQNLWVDVLCIFQDKGARDWHEQSSMMNEIYGGSAVTIAASNSHSCMEGFLQERRPFYIPIEWRAAGGHSTNNDANGDWQHVYLDISWDTSWDEDTGPLTKRGWTMQEVLMPSRILYFTSHQMMWKCCDCINYERGISKEPLQDVKDVFQDGGDSDIWQCDMFMKFKHLSWQLQLLPNHKDSQRYRLWHEIVREYTPRNFSYIQDRLPAVAGLAKVYGQIIGDDQYFAGLWRQDMLCGLSWSTPGTSLSIAAPTTGISPGTDEGPSWSWSSTHPNAIVVNEQATQEFEGLACVEDVKADLVDPSNPFGAVKSGKVRINGPLMFLKSLYQVQWEDPELFISALERFISEKISKGRSQEDMKRYTGQSPDHFAALAMLHHFPSVKKCIFVLLLEKSCSSTEENPPSYKRIGSIKLEFFPQHSIASPKMAKIRDAHHKTRQYRLEPKYTSVRKKNFSPLSKAAFEEFARTPWTRRTVILI